MRISVLALLVLVPAFLLMGTGWTVAGSIGPGAILVGDINVPGVFSVDPTTGNRSLLSGDGVGTGTAFQSPRGIAIEGSGVVLVADTGVDAILAVNPTTGNRTLFSGDGAGSGQAFVLPFGVAINSGGQVFVADAGDGAGDGFIVRVDPTTGTRTLISGLGAGTGDAFGNIRGIAVESNGTLIVSDIANSAIYTVNPVTGLRTILSDATHGTGMALSAPEGVTINAQGKILVADAGDEQILSVDPVTGNRTVISGGGSGAGPAFALPFGIAQNSLGQILLADSGDLAVPALPSIFQVDPNTGNRRVLSNFSQGSGIAFSNFDIGLAVVPSLTAAAVPEPSSLVLTTVGAVSLLGYACCQGLPCRTARR